MLDWAYAKNILCVRLDAMGDLLMTTPAIKALKKACPGRKITLLTSPQGAKIAESMPFIDKVMTYSAPWMKANGEKLDPSPELKLISQLHEEQFDASVIFTVYSQNPLPAALMCYLAEIPLRAAHCRENPYSLLTHWQKEDEPEGRLRHEVRRQLDLVAKLGVSAENLPLSLSIEEEAQESLRKKLEKLVSKGPEECVLIHPGATAKSRQYPTENFAQVADLLHQNLGRCILFTGAEEERVLVETIQDQMVAPSVNLAGKLESKELIALIARGPLLISNNSGPVHVAAAVGTPVVVLYALTNPQHTPWMVPNHVLFADVPCRWCYKSVCPQGTNACLQKIRPEEVFEKAKDLLIRETAPCFDFQAIHPVPMLHQGSEYDYVGK